MASPHQPSRSVNFNDVKLPKPSNGIRPTVEAAGCRLSKLAFVGFDDETGLDIPEYDPNVVELLRTLIRDECSKMIFGQKILVGSLAILGDRICVWTGKGWSDGVSVPLDLRDEIERYMKENARECDG